MKKRKAVLLRVSDFDFASVSRWVAWFSQEAGLRDLDVGGFRSFGVTESGYVGLKRKKEAQLASVESNMKKIERWVEAHEGKIDEEELVLIRSMYRQCLEVSKGVREHVESAKNIVKQQAAEMREAEERLVEWEVGEGREEDGGNPDEDEWPF